jgi:hypothetical protein
MSQQAISPHLSYVERGKTMLFGRAEAVAEWETDGTGTQWVHVTVYLESGRGITVVRDEVLPLLKPIDSPIDVAWHADQYAQETIGNELAELGWEVIGGCDIPEVETGALARSATYALRKVGGFES